MTKEMEELFREMKTEEKLLLSKVLCKEFIELLKHTEKIIEQYDDYGYEDVGEFVRSAIRLRIHEIKQHEKIRETIKK